MLVGTAPGEVPTLRTQHVPLYAFKMPDYPQIYLVNSQKPDARDVATAAGRIERGGLVIFPTNTFYGLGASAFEPAALQRVFDVKDRPTNKPLLVMISALTQLSMLTHRIPTAAETLMQAFWPGGLTILFEAKPDLPRLLTGNTGKIGVRLAGHPVAAALVKQSGVPISGTSANISGNSACTTIQGVEDTIRDRVDVILDAGRLPGGSPSTVVDATGDPVRILREGAISTGRVFSALNP